MFPFDKNRMREDMHEDLLWDKNGGVRFRKKGPGVMKRDGPKGLIDLTRAWPASEGSKGGLAL